jgi:hypothetical protein
VSQRFAILAQRLKLMPTETIELGNAPPEGPFPLEGIIRRGVIRLAHRLRQPARQNAVLKPNLSGGALNGHF